MLFRICQIRCVDIQSLEKLNSLSFKIRPIITKYTNKRYIMSCKALQNTCVFAEYHCEVLMCYCKEF